MTQSLLVALVAALVATPLVAAWARRIGMVARPRADRWHQRPTALLGGIAIFIGIAAGASFTGAARSALPLAIATTAMFALGLYDDARPLRPRAKLFAQLAIGAGYVVAARPVLFGVVALDAALALLALVFVTNALNLLDHIDGLSAGAAAIGAAALAHGLLVAGAPAYAAVACAVAGASLGYLVFNTSPASIFMGDGGSLPLGFLLGALALEQAKHAQALQVRAAPIAFLALPLLDTSLVVVARLSEGRSIAVGGRDHSSHRLVALGLDDRTATLVLHVIGSIAAAAGVLLMHAPSMSGVLAILLVLGLVLAIGSYLLHARPAPPQASLGKMLASPSMRHARRLAHDLAIAGIAYAAAIATRFDGDTRSESALAHVQLLPVVVPAQALLLHLVTRKRASWRDAGGADVAQTALGAAVAAVAAIAIVGASTHRASPGLHAIDAVFLLVIGSASLFARRAIDEMVANARDRRPALVYAHGEECGAVLRTLGRSEVKPVGLVVDDSLALGPSIGGVPVVEGPVERAIARLGVGDVCISSRAAHRVEVEALCVRQGLRVHVV